MAEPLIRGYACIVKGRGHPEASVRLVNGQGSRPGGACSSLLRVACPVDGGPLPDFCRSSACPLAAVVWVSLPWLCNFNSGKYMRHKSLTGNNI